MDEGGVAWDIFLAHAGPDKGVARRLFELLEAQGVAVCFAAMRADLGRG